MDASKLRTGTYMTLKNNYNQSAIVVTKVGKPDLAVAFVPLLLQNSEYNSELIEEAFNVANETGLSPRQLLEQRDNLLSVVKFFEKFDNVETFSEEWEELANQHNEMVEEALALIKQT